MEKLAWTAGEWIWDRYMDGQYSIQLKEDESPVTEADLGANDIICKGLSEFSNIPILSEEDVPDWETRKNWSEYWLIDPLDGTKGFINKTGDFTVNIALIKGGIPVLGVISVPKSGDIYSAELGQGALKNGEPISNTRSGPMTIGVASKLHTGGEAEYLDSLNVADTIYVNSSLKLCWLAEGKADIYPRMRPTMEWDTGAGEILLTESGCEILSQDTLGPLPHNQKDLTNPPFVAYRKSASFLIAETK